MTYCEIHEQHKRFNLMYTIVKCSSNSAQISPSQLIQVIETHYIGIIEDKLKVVCHITECITVVIVNVYSLMIIKKLNFISQKSLSGQTIKNKYSNQLIYQDFTSWYSCLVGYNRAVFPKPHYIVFKRDSK